jgi:superkiller protein 3
MSIEEKQAFMDEMKTPGNDGTSPNNIHTSPVTGTGPASVNAEEQKWTDRGNAAAREGDYERASVAFEHAVSLSPNDARARYNLALAQQYLGDSEIAIAGYRRAIDLDPQLLDAYINLGNLYNEIGLNEDALETFQEALELDPENDDLYVNVGDTYRQLNLYQDAVQAYRQALILNPDNAMAKDGLTDARTRIDDQLHRIMEQERRIDADPADPARYAELASLYLDMRRYNEALSGRCVGKSAHHEPET